MLKAATPEGVLESPGSVAVTVAVHVDAPFQSMVGGAQSMVVVVPVVTAKLCPTLGPLAWL